MIILAAITYAFFPSFVRGFHKAIEELTKYTKGFKKLLNPSSGAYKGMGYLAPGIHATRKGII